MKFCKFLINKALEVKKDLVVKRNSAIKVEENQEDYWKKKYLRLRSELLDLCQDSWECTQEHIEDSMTTKELADCIHKMYDEI